MPDAPVVIGNVLDQPVDGVVGVGALVNLLRGHFQLMRPHVDELPLRHALAAHILKNDDVVCAGEAGGGAERARKVVFAVRDAVGSALHNNRVRFAGRFRRVNHCKEGHAVAHGNARFLTCVVRFHVERLCRIALSLVVFILRLRVACQ